MRASACGASRALVASADATSAGLFDISRDNEAVCVFPPVTTPAHDDGCCPSGANANNDNDCAPDCGNVVVEPGEQCDDGNTNNQDACANNCTAHLGPVAF